MYGTMHGTMFGTKSGTARDCTEHWPGQAVGPGRTVGDDTAISPAWPSAGLPSNRHPDACPALVLNADYTPLSYFPLSLWPWQTALKALFLDRVDIVAHYDRKVRSPSVAIRLPSVIALRRYRKPAPRPAFTRFNLFLRDRFRCQYCASPQDLTFDHVVPRAQGGRTTWSNVTTSCAPCNLKKGGRTPAQAHMALRTVPDQPTERQLREAGRAFPPHYLHESWRDWLYWDAELMA